MPDFGGDVLFTTGTDIQGFCIGLAANVFDESPAWTQIDPTWRVQSVEIRRGRAYEFDRTETGTMTVRIVDVGGDFDPTNTTGPFYLTADTRSIDPLKQAAYAILNPVTSAYQSLFRGFISSVSWVPNRTEAFANVEIHCVDALAILAACELVPDGTFGDTPPQVGDIYYPEDTDLFAVQTRINRVLDDMGWASGLRQIFTGNVKLQEGKYPPRTSALSVIQDAADAEFPGVSNVFINTLGHVTFHGREARFAPEATDASNSGVWGFTDWSCGDNAAVAVDPANVVKISPPLTASRDDQNLYSSAIATYDGISDEAIAGQYVTDAGAVTAFGYRTWSAENLLTLGGATSSTAAQQTKLFADYQRDNASTVRTRIGPLTFTIVRPEDARGAATWDLLCGIDISDRIHVKTTHAGGGGFDDDFFVEGISYTITPHDPDYPAVVMTLDVSPVGYYDADPFS